MEKFYVNAVYDRSFVEFFTSGQNIIGLFKQCKTDGRGNFCGYYASEYYLDTELYAYYTADGRGLYRPDARISELTICEPPIKYKEIQIGSHMWTFAIEADTVEDAIESFRNAVWRDWRRSTDEEVTND